MHMLIFSFDSQRNETIKCMNRLINKFADFVKGGENNVKLIDFFANKYRKLQGKRNKMNERNIQ